MTRWSETDARDWWRSKPWICGFNYLPSTAVNFLEMWHPASFDLPTIERELGWAGRIGFNALRVNLHPLVWQHDRDGVLDRLDRVMAVAKGHGLTTVPTLFDDCGFGGAEPVWGKQPDPVPGVHNSRAVAAPGRAVVCDPTARPGLERYVSDVVATFRADDRILFWDLYNEPGNRMQFDTAGFSTYDAALEPAAHALMRDAFGWARDSAPEQPLSVAAWTTPPPDEDAPPYRTQIDRTALDLSDIVTFHAYSRGDLVARFIDHLAALNRPVFCTEWMARAVGSRIVDQLPLFQDRGVGCFQWGLVKGRTQTHLPWPADLVRAHGGAVESREWFHDLLHPDGRPYDPTEVATIRDLAARTVGPLTG